MIRAELAGYSVAAMLDFFRRHGLDDARIEGLRARGNAYARGVPAIPADLPSALGRRGR